MNPNRVVGVVLLLLGLMLLYFGYQATGTVAERVTETVTGRYTETTMWYLIGGAAAVVAGLVMMGTNVLPLND